MVAAEAGVLIRPGGAGRSRDHAAALVGGVSASLVTKALHLLREAPDLAEQVKRGGITVGAAAGSVAVLQVLSEG